MKLSKSIRKNGRTRTYVPGMVAVSGKFSQSANEPPAGGAPAGGGDPGSGGEPGTGGGADKTFTQTDLNRIATREKAEGKAAAEKAIADMLGCTPAEAAEIIKKSREAEDKTKSEAQLEREKAAKELEAAKAEKSSAAAETHAARIERALAKLGFAGKDEDSERVQRMVTVEIGSSYEDVLKDVTELKKTLNPELFGEKTGGKPGGRLPGGDPKGGVPKPTGGEDGYAAGQARFAERKKARTTFNPLAKTQ